MKNAKVFLLFASASALLLTACASQAPVQRAAVPAVGSIASATTAPASTAKPAAAASRPAKAAPGVVVFGIKYTGTRRVFKDGVEYFCERPTPTGSRFIAPGEQCYTEAQLRARRERDQDFVHRQQELALQTNTTSVVRTPISP